MRNDSSLQSKTFNSWSESITDGDSIKDGESVHCEVVSIREPLLDEMRTGSLNWHSGCMSWVFAKSLTSSVYVFARTQALVTNRRGKPTHHPVQASSKRSASCRDSSFFNKAQTCSAVEQKQSRQKTRSQLSLPIPCRLLVVHDSQ